VEGGGEPGASEKSFATAKLAAMAGGGLLVLLCGFAAAYAACGRRQKGKEEKGLKAGRGKGKRHFQNFGGKDNDLL
jgi:hypothetical protein